MKTSKILCYNGKSDGKRRNPSDFKIFRLLRFARNDKREHPSIPYTLTPIPYPLYPNPYTLPVVCTRKFYKNKQLTGTKTRYVRNIIYMITSP
jgi:hypothetical protein